MQNLLSYVKFSKNNLLSESIKLQKFWSLGNSFSKFQHVSHKIFQENVLCSFLDCITVINNNQKY